MAILKKKLNINSKHYLQLLAILNVTSARSRLIGGCVRDALIGNLSLDVDIATTLLPQQVTAILTAHGIKVLKTGVRFGSVGVLFNDEKFEITTLRSELNCNGRHCDAVFTQDFAVDAARRDFTINALSYCPQQEEIYDYFNGLSDLQKSQVVFIGNPKQRIKEDYLRILRFFRLSILYAKELNQEGLNACLALQTNLQILSKERIIDEMNKILALDHKSSMVALMADKGIFNVILPIAHFDLLIFNKATTFAAEYNIEFKVATKYALLFLPAQELTITDLINLKFSKNKAYQIFDIIAITKRFTSQQDFLLKQIWLTKDDYLQYIIAFVAADRLSQEQAAKFILKYHKLTRFEFMISGHDLLALDIHGKNIAHLLAYLKKLWIDSDFRLSKEQLIAKLPTTHEH